MPVLYSVLIIIPLVHLEVWDCDTSCFLSPVALARGTWVAQLAKHLTLGFGLGHDLSILGSALDQVLHSLKSLLVLLPLPAAPPACAFSQSYK